MNKKKSCPNKLMFVCDYPSVYGGNFIPSLMALEEEMHKYSVDCVYVFPNETSDREWCKTLIANGKQVEFIDFKVGYFNLALTLKKLVVKIGVTKVYAHFGHYIAIELLSLMCLQCKCFIHIHSDFTAGKLNFKYKAANFIVYKLLSSRVKFISVSPAFVKFNSKRVVWVPNALAKKRISVEHKNGIELRRELGISSNDILFEIFGWTPYVKGVDIAVEAIKKANSENCNYKLLIVCGQEYNKEKMSEYIREHTSCDGNEKFLYYVEPSEDVFCYHEAADILLSASRSEGFPYAILEMLSLGKRCVVSDIAGCSWSKKFDSTIFFKSNDIVDCCDVLSKSIDINYNADEVIKQIMSEFNIDRWTNQIATIIMKKVL